MALFGTKYHDSVPSEGCDHDQRAQFTPLLMSLNITRQCRRGNLVTVFKINEILNVVAW